ncbi:hypothetical protein CHUAL_004024 [Chamberlinius hualienensis]
MCPEYNLYCLIVIGFFANSVRTQKELGDVDLGCAQSTYLFGNFCYVVSPTFVTYDDAEMLCETGGGILAPIKDNETQAFLNKLRIRKFLHRFWFGLNDRRIEGEWVFSDGSRLSGYSRWHRGEPNNMGNNQHCVNMWLERHLEWDDGDCSKKLLYVCQYDDVNCTENWPRYGRSCYEVSNEIASYDEADIACQRNGGYLATIKTEGTFSFIKSIIYADRRWKNMTERQIQVVLREQNNKVSWVIDTWIGARFIDGEWKNSDGTLVSYTNWAPGEPFNVRNKEDCVKLGNNWNDVQCDLRHGFMCRYPVKDDITALKFKSEELDNRELGENARLSQLNNESMNSLVKLGVIPFVIALIGCALLGAVITILSFMGVVWLKRYRRADHFQEHQDLEILNEPIMEDHQ